MEFLFLKKRYKFPKKTCFKSFAAVLVVCTQKIPSFYLFIIYEPPVLVIYHFSLGIYKHVTIA